MSRVTNEKKLRKMRGLDRDENGRVWMDIILDVWTATFGVPYYKGMKEN